ncbi:hypothetical protein ACX0G7_09730 [Flavitalea antarctica]
MNPFNFPEATKVFTKPGDWKDKDCFSIAAWEGEQTLPSGDKTPHIITAWKPTPAELEKLNAGGSVYLSLCADGLPPHYLTAHSPFEPQPDVE